MQGLVVLHFHCSAAVQRRPEKVFRATLARPHRHKIASHGYAVVYRDSLDPPGPVHLPDKSARAE
jgi:hypothetical protein